MCVAPVLIKNPNYKNPTKIIQLTTDTESEYIKVPCNHCSECVSARQNQLVDRCRCLSLDHYIFMVTLTYNRESLPHLKGHSEFEDDYGEIHFFDYDVPYADISDVQRMMKRIRKSDPFGRDFLYFGVSERGKERSRPHFHLLIFLKKLPEDDKLYPAVIEPKMYRLFFNEWRRNYGSTRSPIWKPLFTYRCKYVGGKKYSNYDCHYVVPHTTEHGFDDVAFYVSKYVLKTSKKEKALWSALRLNLPEDEFDSVWKVVKSRSFFSKGFGAASSLEVDYVKSCIDRSKSHPEGLKYFHSDGSSSPLPRYYRKFLSPDAAIESVAARGGPLSCDDRDLSEKLCSIERGAKVVQQVAEHDISLFYPLD